MKNILDNLYTKGKINYFYWRKEYHSKVPVKINVKLKMWQKGFLSESFHIYDLSSKDSAAYLSDKQRLKSNYINGKYAFVLNNKIIFEQMYKDLLSIPETLALVNKGRIISRNKKVKDVTTLVQYIKEKGNVVIKPISGGGGFGVRIVKFQDGQLYSNNELITQEQLANDLSKMDEYFISDFIQQGNFSSSLNPGTLNSMRIVTAIDPDTNEAFIPIAVQRIGTKKSAPADNWTQGGISAEIDVSTGAMKKGASYPSDGNLVWHQSHPDTGAQIEGISIPKWEEIKDMIINTANAHPYIKYIGWDVVSTDDGIMVIEANNCTDVNLLQIHRPLLKDKRLKRFYEYYNVI